MRTTSKQASLQGKVSRMSAKAPVTDSRWEETAQPVFEFLKEPRTWVALHAFRRTIRMDEWILRNCLAWLEAQGRAMSFKRKGVVIWAFQSQTTTPSDPQPITTPADEELLRRMLPEEDDFSLDEGLEEEDCERFG